jgi:GntR family transcriptional repressor for pyruvate dehydrogenase complex
VPKASDALAGELREKILNGDLAVGDALPHERRLAEEKGLSRVSVRDALRVLEFEGLVRTRQGRNGGSFVSQPGDATVSRAVESYVRAARISLRDLIDVREAIEPAAAELAALRRSDADLERLERIQRRHEHVTGKAYLRENVAWHVGVAEASQNGVFAGTLRAIAGELESATTPRELNPPEVRAATLAIHRRILDAIRGGDGAAARRRMARHLAAYRKRLTAIGVEELPS